MALRGAGLFDLPFVFGRDVDAPTAGVDGGDYVGFHRIADHHGTVGAVSVAHEGADIGLGCFVGDDFDGVEQLSQTRLCKFAFLVEKIALGDQHDLMAVRERLYGFARMRQQMDRVGEHVLARGDDLGNHGGRNALVCDLDRCFDHREHEAFDAEAILAKIAALSLQELGAQMIRVGVVGEKFRESLLGQAEEFFVLPQRIVGIEADCGEFLCHSRQTDPFLDIHASYIVGPRIRKTAKGLRLKPFEIIMSGKDEEGDADTGIATKTKPKTQRPPMYKVMLLNDDYTPMEFVVLVLEKFFAINHAQSVEIMLTVHKKGLAVVGVFAFEIAETKVAQVMDFARRNQHPLQCTMEKE